MGGAIKHFTDLNVWKQAHALTLSIYSLTAIFPKNEHYGLSNQLRRAAVSIAANIAEGMGRKSYADRARFFYGARGSICETESHLIISKDLNYIQISAFNDVMELLCSTRMMLNAFITRTIEMKNEGYRA